MSLFEEPQNGGNGALEFKEASPKDSLKFTKMVVAFANGKGGRILFGAKDNAGRGLGVSRENIAA